MKIVIVGNGPAALSAVEEIRRYDDDCEITIVSREKGPAYTPCFLPKYVCGEIPKEKLYLRSGGFHGKHRIKLMEGVAAVEIVSRENLLKLSDGSAIQYDQLLLAAGAEPIDPGIPGMKGKGAFFFKSLEDAELIRTMLKNAKEAVVIGSGFIGLEVAEALFKAGLRVTVVEKEAGVLPRMFDAELSEMVQEHITEKGIKVITGREVVSVNRSRLMGKLHGVALSGGENLACDIIIISIGLKPNLEMVKDASIMTGRGVMVDGHMRTNIPNIFAAGDIAEIEIDGLKKVNPVHINAVKTGAVAGSNMAGIERTLPEHVEDMNLVTLFDMPFLSIGVQRGGRVLKRNGKNGMVKIYQNDGGIIRGVQMVRDVRRGGVYLSMMRRHVPVTEKMDILSPRFNYGMTAWTF